jgi:hypothetical protein
MAKKTSNLKIVQQQTPTEDELRAHEEDSWRLTRSEITGRARALREELEAARARLDGMTFDVITDDIPHSLNNYEKRCVTELVDAFDPCIEGHFKRVEDLVGESCVHDDLSNLKWQTAETAYQIGMLAGAMFSGASDREIDRLERGLIHATVSRKWRCKGSRVSPNG